MAENSVSTIQLAGRGDFDFIWSDKLLRRYYKYWYFRLTSRYESHVYQAGLNCYRPGTVLIDAGAFVGIHAISWAEQIDGRVIAFEPVPASFRVLEKNMQRHHCLPSQLTCYPYALGNENGSCCILDDTLRSHIVRADQATCSAAQVEMRRLDDCGIEQEVSVIKLDVEGHELEVLKGAERLIKRWRPAILFENKPGYNYFFMRQPNMNRQINAYLKELGYTIRKLKCYDYLATTCT